MQKQKSQGKAVEVTVNRKEENSLDFCMNFKNSASGHEEINNTDCTVFLQNLSTVEKLLLLFFL